MKERYRRKIVYAACLLLLVLIVTLGMLFRGKGPNATAETGEAQSSYSYSSGEESTEKEDFLSRYPACTKNFDEIVPSDQEELEAAERALDALMVGTVSLLDSDAIAQGYSNFRALLEDRVYKAKFQQLKSSTLADLQTVLRGCDEGRVRAVRDETLIFVSDLAYGETFDDAARASVFEALYDDCVYALETLEEARAVQRAENQIEEECQKRMQRGEYDETQSAALTEIANRWKEAVWSALGSEDIERIVQEYLLECYAEFDAV